MGCSVSRPDQTLISSASNTDTIENSLNPKKSNQIPRTFSLPTPLVHHPPLKKGDSHHLVSLTSTTYGSLLLIDSNPNPNFNDPDHLLSPSSKTLTHPSSPDSVINTWELMAGLDDFDYPVSKKSSSLIFDRSFSFNSTKKPNLDRDGSVKSGFVEGNVKRLCNSFEAAKLARTNSSNLAKPLWKHLSEESLLADMDPNVATSFRRAISARQLGFNSSKTMKPAVSLSRFSPFMDDKIRLKGTEDRIVLYFTSLRGIRRTYEDCCTVRNIFRGFRVSVDERDISMDSAYRKELQGALGEKTVTLPRVFIRGKYLGGAEEIKQLHEVGELAKLLEGFPVKDPRLVCESCGDLRFIPCLNCNGSRKVFAEEEEQLRRCPDCNENGLIRCPNCCY
ncbi:Glutaredoxin [Macleaya cordata]|uniref:Glutaredoxin n=1 Tax=Macleaya cordata TaxID=56857 RepID=A0A200PSH1_MACCD|nr:Glutaredoxin [Macleaya cordata]